MPLPYATPDFAGIGGVIKERPEDFFVQEVPLYQPCGQGDHLYCEVRKVGLSTFDAVNRLADALGVAPRDIGFAGMKDAQAVTSQLFSIPGVAAEAAMKLQSDELAVQWAIPHGNKLRLGHLAGNRFAIRIRQVNPTDAVKVQPVLRQLEERGLPNYFGEQRFGRRHNNHLVGAAMVRADHAETLRLVLGDPQPEIDNAQALGARKAFERGDLAAAMKLYPRSFGMERRVLARLIKTGKPLAAVRAIDERLRRLWISALQSELFNQVVARRLPDLGTIQAGDLAWLHHNGACFLVTDAAAEQPRADRFEISPTGPLVGYRMTLPEGPPAAVEQEALTGMRLAAEDFRAAGWLKVKGARRPLRVRPTEVDLSAGVDQHGPHLTVAFTLPPGSYATVLLREIMKPERGDI